MPCFILKTHDLSSGGPIRCYSTRSYSLLVPAPVDKLGRLGWPPECVLAKTETLAALLPHFRRRHTPEWGVGSRESVSVLHRLVWHAMVWVQDGGFSRVGHGIGWRIEMELLPPPPPPLLTASLPHSQPHSLLRL